MTVNPLSSGNTSQAHSAKPAARLAQNQPQTQNSAALRQDTVSLSHAAQQGVAAAKSSGDVNHDGDGH